MLVPKLFYPSTCSYLRMFPCMSHKSGEEEYNTPSNDTYSFVDNPLPAEEMHHATISETFPSQFDHVSSQSVHNDLIQTSLPARDN